MLWKIDTQSSQPLHEQLAGQLRRGIATEALEEGEKLPAARELAKGLGVNVHTVLRAFQTLRDEGLLEVRRGRGTSVAAAAKSATRHVELARRLVREARRSGMGDREILKLVEVQL
ncbi:MAG: GntR family transcriptional regulator [Actinomycetia bacterium]|nr:GntR family transcriptional regulator [Actinomycetes bacterium]